MNKVFPLKWYNQIDRSMWGPGPWDAELEDREQWSDAMTGYPCLAIRCQMGGWAGYVGVYPDHPAFGAEVDLPGHICDYGHTDDHRFIAPWPLDPEAVVDEDDPKKSILDVVRMPDYLWFFGFDFLHAGDLIPSVNNVLAKSLKPCKEKQLGTYKDLAHVKKTCATVALALSRMSGTKTMDSTRQRVFASSI
jgi:hypothetical protein